MGNARYIIFGCIIGASASWSTNIFVEQPWERSKHEDVYLKNYGNVVECRAGLVTFLNGIILGESIRIWGTDTPKMLISEALH
jgi:hypothetical protein